MTIGVIRVALERDVRTGSRHPHVERIMQKQIRQDGAYDPSLRTFAARRCHPPSLPEPSASARYRAAPTVGSYDDGGRMPLGQTSGFSRADPGDRQSVV